LPETVLVTGATGFIGSALCKALVTQGHRVRALHRHTSPLDLLRGVRVEHAIGDILQPDTLRQALQGVDWVFHAAAVAAYWRQRPETVLQAAVEGTGNIVEAARAAGVRRVVLTSSLAAMGLPRHGELLDERHTYDLPPNHFIYGYAKYQAELAALRLAERGPELVITNPSIVLGPGDVHQISGSLVVEAARGRAFLYTEGGVNIVHIDDVVAGHIAAARRGRPGERYILGGENLTHRQLFTILTQVVGRRPPWLKLPTWTIGPLASAVDLLRTLVPMPLNGDQLRLSRYHLYCDTSKAERELALPKPRPFRAAAEEAYAWYRQQGVL